MIDYERQAITSTARLPRRAGPNGRAVRCKGMRGGRECGNILAVVDGGNVFYVDGGMELTASLPAAARCDRCGRRTMLDTNTPID